MHKVRFGSNPAANGPSLLMKKYNEAVESIRGLTRLPSLKQIEILALLQVARNEITNRNFTQTTRTNLSLEARTFIDQGDAEAVSPFLTFLNTYNHAFSANH